MRKDAKKHISDEVFLKNVKTKLDEGMQEIDPATETRLRAIRRQAVEQAGERHSFRAWQWGSAVAATVVVAIFLTFNIQNENTSNSDIDNLAALEDLQMLSASDDLDMYQDLEFYSWLNEIQKTG